MATALQVEQMSKPHDNRMIRRSKYGKNKLKPAKRVFVYVFIGLFAFFARYTVHFGHDCEVLSPWKIIKGVETTTAKKNTNSSVARSHCHHTNSEKESDKKRNTNHNHETCPICSAYDQLQSGAALTCDINFQITNATKQVVSAELNGIVLFQKNNFNHSPRSPPV